MQRCPLRRSRIAPTGAALVIALGSGFLVAHAQTPPPPVRQASAERAALAQRILQADYGGDVEALGRLWSELLPDGENARVTSRLRYWRGFARWRRALNGLNLPTPDPLAIVGDLDAAQAEFELALAADPAFTDATVAIAGCLASEGFLLRADTERRKVLLEKYRRFLDQAWREAPGNPRVLWVAGGNAWWTPPHTDASEAKALDLYRKGLAAARAQQPGTDPLEPTWGEPEVLMAMAWAELNRAQPDALAAERHARAALALVPGWHYVKDVLLPRIAAARKE